MSPPTVKSLLTTKLDNVPTLVMFGCAAFTTEYANSDNAAGAKLAPPASDNIKLPISCILACCVTGSPAVLTTATNVLAAILLPIFGNCVILIAELDVAINSSFYFYNFTTELMLFSAIYHYLHNM